MQPPKSCTNWFGHQIVQKYSYYTLSIIWKKNILPAWLCRLLSALRWVITLSRAVLHHNDQNSKVYSCANDRIIKLINFNPRKFSIVRHAYFRWSNSLLWIKSLVHLGVNKLVSIIHCVDSFTGESIGHALRSHQFQCYRQNSVILVIQKCENFLSGEMSCYILVNLPVVQLVSSKSYAKKICEITKVYVIAKALFTSSCLNLAAKMKFMTSQRVYVYFNLSFIWLCKPFKSCKSVTIFAVGFASMCRPRRATSSTHDTM